MKESNTHMSGVVNELPTLQRVLPRSLSLEECCGRMDSEINNGDHYNYIIFAIRYPLFKYRLHH